MNKILIAEDDKFLANVLNAKLQKEGFEVIQAFNGEEAFTKIREVNPDLILLDLVMPGKDGFDVLKELKNDKSLKDIPVIILSNLGQEEDVTRGRELGADDYLIKTGFSLKQVVEKVEQYLKS